MLARSRPEVLRTVQTMTGVRNGENLEDLGRVEQACRPCKVRAGAQVDLLEDLGAQELRQKLPSFETFAPTVTI